MVSANLPTSPRRSTLLNQRFARCVEMGRRKQELSHDIKSRLYVVHVSQSSIPEGSGLRVAPVGVEHTIRLQTPGNSFSGAMEVLDFISSVGMLSNISVGQVTLLRGPVSQLKLSLPHGFAFNTLNQLRLGYGRANETSVTPQTRHVSGPESDGCWADADKLCLFHVSLRRVGFDRLVWFRGGLVSSSSSRRQI